MPPTIDPQRDYIQLVHNHTKNPTYEQLSKIGPDHDPTFTYRLLLEGIEQSRASDGNSKRARKICAYKYLKGKKLVARDDDMEALL